MRETRKLSLDTVAEMTSGYPEKITKSHLSRIENGHAEPTFRRLHALSQIYDVPVSTMAQQFSLELRRAERRATADVDHSQVSEARAREFARQGSYFEALDVVDRMFDAGLVGPGDHARLRLYRVDYLNRVNYTSLAREELEELLDSSELDSGLRARAYYLLAVACRRLGRISIAQAIIERARDCLGESTRDPRLEAMIANLTGILQSMVGDHDSAVRFQTDAMRLWLDVSDRFEWCRSAVNAAAAYAARGTVVHARRLLTEVIRVAESHGYDRQLAYALSNLASIAWKSRDLENTRSYALRSNSIARSREYVDLVFTNSYYLWLVYREREDHRGARLEERTLKTYIDRVDYAFEEKAAFERYLAEEV